MVPPTVVRSSFLSYYNQDNPTDMPAGQPHLGNPSLRVLKTFLLTFVFIFWGRGVLPACGSVYHMHEVPAEVPWNWTVVSCHVGVRN